MSYALDRATHRIPDPVSIIEATPEITMLDPFLALYFHVFSNPLRSRVCIHLQIVEVAHSQDTQCAGVLLEEWQTAGLSADDILLVGIGVYPRDKFIQSLRSLSILPSKNIATRIISIRSRRLACTFEIID